MLHENRGGHHGGPKAVAVTDCRLSNVAGGNDLVRQLPDILALVVTGVWIEVDAQDCGQHRRGEVFSIVAWWGDPAFDLAFCLNHLLLKCLWTPSARARFLACFDALVAAYRAGITWEPADALEGRAARLLPGLFLARVDGKSPVEYITTEIDRNHVRRAARKLLTDPVDHLDAVRSSWAEELAA